MDGPAPVHLMIQFQPSIPQMIHHRSFSLVGSSTRSTRQRGSRAFTGRAMWRIVRHPSIFSSILAFTVWTITAFLEAMFLQLSASARSWSKPSLIFLPILVVVPSSFTKERVLSCSSGQGFYRITNQAIHRNCQTITNSMPTLAAQWRNLLVGPEKMK